MSIVEKRSSTNFYIKSRTSHKLDLTLQLNKKWRYK